MAKVKHTVSGDIVDPQAASPELLLPPELVRITMRALKRQREERYQTVAELQHDLEQFLRGGGWLATRSYAEGAAIIREGDVASEAYIIVSGRCEAFKVVEDRRVLLRHMGPGDVFGETAILTRKPRSASVVAASAVTVKVVTAAALEQELSRNAFMDTFVRALAGRFRELDAKLHADQVR